MAAFRHTALVALSLAVAGTAGAQGDKCVINDGKPFQINSAKIYLNKGSGASVEKQDHLRAAIKVLTENPEKIDNQLGRNFLLSRAYLTWMNEPGMSGMVKRSQVGYTVDRDGQIDLLAALDTSLTQVVTLAPACADSMAKLRRAPYARLLNAGIGAYNANQLDSAAYYTKRALVVMPRSVSAHNMLVNVAQKQNRPAEAVEYMRKVVEYSAGDTSATKVRHVTMYNLAVLAANEAEAKPEAERKQAALAAAEQFRAFLKEVPGDPNGQQGLARALQLSGDTAAVAGIYGDMMADPSKYTDIQLFEAGVAASRSKQQADAAKLYEAGLAKNPYYRDGLFNLATTYYTLGDHERLFPIVRRLVEVDPNNPDNYRLLAGAYRLQMDATKDEKAKKAYTDSVVALLDREKKFPVRVSFNQFTHNGASHVVVGTVENRGTAAASYTMKVEFVDKDGKVVASQDVSVGPVAPKASAEFTAKVEGTGIVAFRTTPIK